MEDGYSGSLLLKGRGKKLGTMYENCRSEVELVEWGSSGIFVMFLGHTRRQIKLASYSSQSNHFEVSCTLPEACPLKQSQADVVL